MDKKRPIHPLFSARLSSQFAPLNLNGAISDRAWHSRGAELPKNGARADTESALFQPSGCISDGLRLVQASSSTCLCLEIDSKGKFLATGAHSRAFPVRQLPAKSTLSGTHWYPLLFLNSFLQRRRSGCAGDAVGPVRNVARSHIRPHRVRFPPCNWSLQHLQAFLRHLPLPGLIRGCLRRNSVRSLSFSHDGQYIAMASDDGRVEIVSGALIDLLQSENMLVRICAQLVLNWRIGM